MARIEVGGTADDFAFNTYAFAGHQLLELGGAGTLTWWSAASGGTQYTDLLLNAGAVTSIPISNGWIPAHSWPDGVTQAWGSTDGGATRLLMRAPGTGGGGGGATTLDGLTDVAITSPASGHIPRHNGTQFVNVLGTTHFEVAGAVAAANLANVVRAADVARVGLPNKTLVISTTDPAPLGADEIWVYPADAGYTINAQTGTTYTAVLADAGTHKLTTFTNAAAITYTIPPNSSVAYPVGAVLNGATGGAGQVTITPGAAVTFKGTNYKSAREGAMWAAVKIATNTWLVNGDLSA